MRLTRTIRTAGLACLLALAASAHAQATAGRDDPAPTGWLRSQQFDAYSPLAAKAELIDRVLVPTLADRIRRFERASGRHAAEHTIDLADERFDLFVPEVPASGSYALLVFVPPMPEFPLSSGWKSVLRRQGMIFVAARRSGNEQNVLDRRIPLALHALHNVSLRWPVDPGRVYVSGFSGGSRVAWRIARAYADVFSGVLLIGGSDAFGEPGTAPPQAQLMRHLRERSRIVFATGGSDLPNRGKDARTIASLEAFCVPGVRTIPVPRVDHWVPPARRFAEALRALEQPLPPADTAACERALEARIGSGMAEVERLFEAGDAAAAGDALGDLEDRFGGLLPPRALELARAIAARLAAAP